MDLTPRDLTPGTPLVGVPGHARRLRAGPCVGAVWSETGTLPHPVSAALVHEDSGGSAWLRLEPTTLALQLQDIAGRIGDREVTLRRNRPRLRRSDRVVRISGPSLRWRLTSVDGEARVRDASGREVWRRAPDGTRWAADDLDVDHLAALVLYDHIDLAQRTAGPNPFRYV